MASENPQPVDQPTIGGIEDGPPPGFDDGPPPGFEYVELVPVRVRNSKPIRAHFQYEPKKYPAPHLRDKLQGIESKKPLPVATCSYSLNGLAAGQIITEVRAALAEASIFTTVSSFKAFNQFLKVQNQLDSHLPAYHDQSSFSDDHPPAANNQTIFDDDDNDDYDGIPHYQHEIGEDGILHSASRQKHGPYKCLLCDGLVFDKSQGYAAHVKSVHFKLETKAQRKRRHDVKYRRKNLRIFKSHAGLTIAPKYFKSSSGRRNMDNRKRTDKGKEKVVDGAVHNTLGAEGSSEDGLDGIIIKEEPFS